MNNTMLLVGTERVQNAGTAMSQAADRMQSAAGYYDATVLRLERALENHQVFMDDWLSRLAQVMEQAHADK